MGQSKKAMTIFPCTSQDPIHVKLKPMTISTCDRLSFPLASCSIASLNSNWCASVSLKIAVFIKTPGPRQQLAQLTSYHDASMIYGSTSEETLTLRDMDMPRESPEQFACFWIQLREKKTQTKRCWRAKLHQADVHACPCNRNENTCTQLGKLASFNICRPKWNGFLMQCLFTLSKEESEWKPFAWPVHQSFEPLSSFSLLSPTCNFLELPCICVAAQVWPVLSFVICECLREHLGCISRETGAIKWGYVVPGCFYRVRIHACPQQQFA